MKTMRASIWALGPLVARFGQGRCHCRGCAIGARPVDLHIFGLEKLGAEIKLEEGYVKASVNGRLKGAHCHGQSERWRNRHHYVRGNAGRRYHHYRKRAREPEIVDTANFLVALGAKSLAVPIASPLKALSVWVAVCIAFCQTVLKPGLSVAAAISGGKIVCRNAQPDTGCGAGEAA